MTLQEKYGTPLFPAHPDTTPGRLCRLDAYLEAGKPVTAKQRRREAALAIYPEAPLDVLCQPPYTEDSIAALKLIMLEGGPLFSEPMLKHLFNLRPWALRGTVAQRLSQ